MPEHYTRAEAEALLPRLEGMLRELQLLRDELAEQEEQYTALRTRVLSNGHNMQGNAQRLKMAIATMTAQITQRIHAIAELGVIVKDLEAGLVDFPALRGGREVYLCWRLGEDHIGWWHEVDSGFAGRQPLEE
ncbi:MAG TPA: DUF2203 domain-containing protein [Ktedonobacterales bacterium]|jgi:hypothetical protein|nr:DUF2203 domain-containing protein [Ktedonobacterales bacterium]